MLFKKLDPKKQSSMPQQCGFILINKPKDWTSHDVVAYLRKVTGVKKIGHAGTLDPFATGLLIVGIGREATKHLDEFKAMPKEYVATLRLGATSDTYDSTGNLTIKQFNNKAIAALSEKKIKEVLSTFIGRQNQLPPMYSAKKVGGKKLYELARKGIEIERKPSKIEIYQLNIIDYNPNCSMLRVSCSVSTGTYIRTLAHDIGQKLDCGAYCEELARIKIGDYSVEDALEPTKFNPHEYGSEWIKTTP